MNGFAAPLKVMHELMWWVTLFQNKSIVKQLIKFDYNINFLVVSYFASEFSELSYFKNEVFLNLIELRADEFKRVEVPFVFVLLEVSYLSFKFVKLF
jgi:hypothetical protein